MPFKIPPILATLVQSALLIFFIVSPGTAANPPRVAVTIKPIHSLVAGVMDGISVGNGNPYLVVRGVRSPHDFTLTPSGARQLQSAQVIFMIGAGLEPALNTAIKTLGAGARIVELSHAPGIQLLNVRDSSLPVDQHSQHDTIDPHIWLDPINAKAMVRMIAKTMREADPVNGARYVANSRDLLQRLDILSATLTAQLKPVKHKPFIAFHDAFQYFENRFELHAASTITVSPHISPSVTRIIRIQKLIRQTSGICIFNEPGYQPKLINVLKQNAGVRIGMLTPLGVDLNPGPALYFELMRRNAQAIYDCLGTR
jgi:zinc transport system substrate-binding protein